MKQKKIVLREIKQWHPGNRAYQTDAYYQKLANRLLKAFSILEDDLDRRGYDITRRSAIKLTNYMEDIVSDCGVWHAYSNMCQGLYGHPVPLYHRDEEYYHDEPSMNAIRHMIWNMVSDITDDLVFAEIPAINEMAHLAHYILCDVFEDAPINEELADDIDSMLDKSITDFNELRHTLKWLYKDCYLIAGEKNDTLISRYFDSLSRTSAQDNDMPISDSMAYYVAFTTCIFKYKVGPLACYAKDYLAALMRTKGMEQEAAEVAGIEVIDAGTYKVNHAPSESLTSKAETPDNKRLILTRTNGRQIEINAQELNLDEKQLESIKGIMASSFVHYQGEWHLNGMILSLDGIEKEWEDWCKKDPDYIKPGTMTLTAQEMLKRTGGQRIAYFADLNQMKDFLEQKLQVPRHLLGFVTENENDRPTLFIDTDEAKNCLQFFFGLTSSIADPDNPYYDKNEARRYAFDFLWNAEAVTTHAVNYLLEHDFLPDIYDDQVLSQFSTHEQKRHDIDFLMRFYRRELY